MFLINEPSSDPTYDPTLTSARGVGPARERRQPIIEVRSGAFGYADRPVIRGVDLTVHPGEVVAVLGPNGAGKSTLVRGLLGLADQLDGQTHLFGVPRAAFRDHPRLGYVPQRHTLSATVRATAAEIVATGRLARRPWWRRPGPTDRARVVEALTVVGLHERAATDVSTLSGGQQRRVLIARALAGQPDVLIMDEPTAGVDAANQQVLAAVLGRLAEDGVTMLIVTHELAAIAALVTRVVIVDNGGIAFDGSPAEVADRPEMLRDHPWHHHDHMNRVRAGDLIVTDGPLDAGARTGGGTHG